MVATLLCPTSSVPTETKPDRAEETPRTVHIMLVEGSQVEVRRFQEFLQEVALPITLHTVDRSAGALAFLRQAESYAQAPRPQVILLDLELPKLDGDRLLEERANDLVVVNSSNAWRANVNLQHAESSELFATCSRQSITWRALPV